ncbi:MAG: efflux RND transporter periplasmic adaptor subunit [Desulfobacteraceae bacterium]|nr:MAG: efflux RND transporter periplasmic adaptor subunit [Desulfobacteraceae bacterium]
MKPMTIQTILLLGISAVLTACGNDIKPGTTAPGAAQTIKAPVAEAHISQTPFLYEAVATINARTASTISAKLMGTVQALHVQEGTLVHKGDLLLTIDPRTVTAQLEQAQAGLREARRAEASAVSARDAAAAAAELTAATYRRYKQLLDDNSVSRQEFEEVESRGRQAKAALAQTEAMIEAARSRVQQAEAASRQAGLAQKDARVLAPYDGQVVAKMIAEGDLATPGAPLLILEQEGVFCADLVLPERHIQSVKLGMPVKVQVPALNNLGVTGEIGRIIPTADTQSRSFEIKVAMPEGLDLKSGMFARVFLPIGGTGILLVPQTAVVNEGQLTGLFVVGPDGIARFRLVRTGKHYGEQVEIFSGLQEGQRFVSDVPVTLKDGMKVEGV